MSAQFNYREAYKDVAFIANPRKVPITEDAKLEVQKTVRKMKECVSSLYAFTLSLPNLIETQEDIDRLCLQIRKLQWIAEDTENSFHIGYSLAHGLRKCSNIMVAEGQNGFSSVKCDEYWNKIMNTIENEQDQQG